LSRNTKKTHTKKIGILKKRFTFLLPLRKQKSANPNYTKLIAPRIQKKKKNEEQKHHLFEKKNKLCTPRKKAPTVPNFEAKNEKRKQQQQENRTEEAKELYKMFSFRA